MSRSIRIWLKMPGCIPQEMNIADTFENYRELIGGLLEAVKYNNNLWIICDEEGKLKALPYNCTIKNEQFVGPIIFIGASGDKFTDCPCSEEALRRLFPQLW